MRPELIAPLAENEEVGTISVRIGDEEFANRGLIALEAVAEAGFFGRTWDGMSMWFDGLFSDDEG
jgi:D-alanyl-D-alanine carboxypeptidase (penicillin-binding protein 5/6)